MQRLLFLLLLICLPLQGLASQIADAWVDHAASSAHEIAHIQEVQHHHDDDGTVHYDDSEASLEHSGDHSHCTQLSLISPTPLALKHDKSSIADFPDPASWIPSPYLDDPQRPPAFAPGLAAGG